MANRLKSILNEDGQVVSSFKGASGKEYQVRKADDVFSFIRLNEFHKLSLMLQYGKSIEDQQGFLQQTKKLLNRAAVGQGFVEVAVHIDEMERNLISISEEKYEISAYLCTLFIVSKDEDITRWSKSEATTKIDDWREYRPFDFFLLAMNLKKELRDLLKKMQQEKVTIP